MRAFLLRSHIKSFSYGTVYLMVMLGPEASSFSSRLLLIPDVVISCSFSRGREIFPEEGRGERGSKDLRRWIGDKIGSFTSACWIGLSEGWFRCFYSTSRSLEQRHTVPLTYICRSIYIQADIPEVLCYEPVGRGFDSQSGYRIFKFT